MDFSERYFEPPVRPAYIALKYAQGFRFIDTGFPVSMGDIFPAGNFSIRGDILFRSIPREYAGSPEVAEKIRPRLFLPVGNQLRTVDAYTPFVADDVILYQRFAGLNGDDDILDFACQYGLLCGNGIQYDYEHSVILLESVNTWRAEISAVRTLLRVWAEHTVRKPVEEYLHYPTRDTVQLVLGGETVSLPFILSESKRDTVYRGMAHFIDRKNSDCSLSVCHVQDGERFRSYLVPKDLRGAIWLQISQSFFRDGPSEVMGRLCYRSGKFFPESCMSKRTKGPYAGLYYNRREKNKGDQRKHKRKKAAEAGRTVKAERKGREDFFVDDF